MTTTQIKEYTHEEAVETAEAYLCRKMYDEHKTDANYSQHLDEYEKAVRNLVGTFTDDYLDKDSKAGILLELEEELRREYEEENE